MKVSDERRDAYLKAYDDWQKQLSALHEVFLEGKQLVGDQMKGLLNREARAKQRYDEARLELLGIPQPADSPFD
ncbi:MAG TPA: hypothetical protein VIE40_01130 [Dehalococcoidia bacterium]|jgi:hypothetical protein